MRKLISIILVLISLVSYGQTPTPSNYLVQPAKWKFVNKAWLDSGCYLDGMQKYANQMRVLVQDSVTTKVGYKYISVATPTLQQVTTAGATTSVEPTFSNGLIVSGGSLNVTGTTHEITATTQNITLVVPATKAIILNAGSGGEIQLNGYATCDEDLQITRIGSARKFMADTFTFNSPRSYFKNGSSTAKQWRMPDTSGTVAIMGKFSTTDATKLPLAGGTMTGNLLFSDNTYDIGTSGSRVRNGYFGTSVGIGTTTLTTVLNLSKSSNSSEGLKISNTSTGTDAYGSIVFENNSSSLAGGFFMCGSNNTQYAGAGSINIGTILTNTPVGFVTNNLLRQKIFGDGHTVFQTAPVATPNYGNVSIGSGNFAGSGFTGSSSGTSLMISEVSGYAGDYVNFGKGTTSYFKVDNVGNTTAAKYYVSAMNTAPANASDTGTLGEIRVTATYIYVCTATNTWVRTALATW